MTLIKRLQKETGLSAGFIRRAGRATSSRDRFYFELALIRDTRLANLGDRSAFTRSLNGQMVLYFG